MELDESSAHPLGIGESHAACDLLDRLRPIPQPQARGLDAQTFDSAGRRFPRLPTEGTAELPRAKMRGLGQTLHAQLL